MIYPFFLKDLTICNFADDTTTNVCAENLENVLKSLEKKSVLAKYWFENNFMKYNPENCHLIFSGYKDEEVWENIEKDMILKRNDVKLFGISI